MSSPAQAVNKKYRELARLSHPDRPGGNEDLFKTLTAARDALLASDSDDSEREYGFGSGENTSEDYFHQLAVTLEEMYTGRISFIGMKRKVVSEDGCSLKYVRETLRVEVPLGSSGRDQIIFDGKADEVPGSSGVGRLVLCIKELPHHIFQRSGAHLLHIQIVPLLDALCGDCPYSIEHLDARTLRIKAPRALKAVEAWRVAGEGMPLAVSHSSGKDGQQSGANEYGDLFCLRVVKFPESLSAEQCAVVKTVLPPPCEIPVPEEETLPQTRRYSATTKSPSRRTARLRSIKRSEFESCISGFPSIYGKAVFYNTSETFHHSNSESATSKDTNFAQTRSREKRAARRWSVDDDDGFDAAALNEDDSGECETQ